MITISEQQLDSTVDLLMAMSTYLETGDEYWLKIAAQKHDISGLTKTLLGQMELFS